MRLLRPSSDEHGIAMITAILVSGVVLTLSITATSLAIHNTNASGLDRKRVQVIATAEAGVDAAFSVLQTTPTAALPCQIQATLQGAFAQAIFSDQSPSTNNNLTVNGQNGDDATVYTNGSWTCANSMIVHGSMVAQGSVSMSNSCQVTRDVWAKQAVTMQNNTLVGHNVSSSRSSITLLNSAHILNNATAGTTITSNGRIDGTSTQNASPNDPPPQSLPAV